jgi:nucleoside-diphosphate-sugar epimerase
MTRVLVTGASGFMGRALCAALGKAGHEVVASTRGAAEPWSAGLEIRPIPDIGPGTDWSGALAGVEVVAHLAARVHVMKERHAQPLAAYRRVNTEGTRRLAEAAAASGVRRVVFLSTVKVNGEASGSDPFRESDAPVPGDDYALSKWEGEQALAEVAARTGLETVVLRSPLVYGPGVKGNFLRLLELCRRAPPLPLGAASNLRSLMFLGNLTNAVTACLVRPEAAGQTYLMSDGEDVSTAELIHRIGVALGRPARLFPVPGVLLRLAGHLTGKSDAVGRLLESLAIDDGKIRKQLDWAPPFTMAQGLAETVSWFASRRARDR